MLLGLSGVLLVVVLVADRARRPRTAGPAPTTGPASAPAKAGSGPVVLDAKTFDAAVADGVVLVDFWAPWCGPCRVQGPILDDLAATLGGRARIAKVNVDDNGALARRMDVSGIPTLVLLKDGREVRRFVGVQPKQKLLEAVEPLLRP